MGREGSQKTKFDDPYHCDWEHTLVNGIPGEEWIRWPDPQITELQAGEWGMTLRQYRVNSRRAVGHREQRLEMERLTALRVQREEQMLAELAVRREKLESLAHGNLSAAEKCCLLATMSHEDQAEALALMSAEDRAATLLAMTATERAALLLTMSDENVAAALGAMSPQEQAKALCLMDPAERAKVLALMSPEERASALARMSPEELAATIGAMSDENKESTLAGMPPSQREAALAAVSAAELKQPGHHSAAGDITADGHMLGPDGQEVLSSQERKQQTALSPEARAAAEARRADRPSHAASKPTDDDRQARLARAEAEENQAREQARERRAQQFKDDEEKHLAATSKQEQLQKSRQLAGAKCTGTQSSEERREARLALLAKQKDSAYKPFGVAMNYSCLEGKAPNPGPGY